MKIIYLIEGDIFHFCISSEILILQFVFLTSNYSDNILFIPE